MCTTQRTTGRATKCSTTYADTRSPGSRGQGSLPCLALSRLTLILWMHRRAQLHQPEVSFDVSTAKHKLAPACFRISNVPPTWNERNLLQAIRSSDDSPDLASTAQYRLSFYPACSGSRQTALLNLQSPGCQWNLQSNEDKLIRGEDDSDIVMDRHFRGLTPLNTPEGEIVAE